MLAIPVGVAVAALYVLGPKLRAGLGPQLVAYMASTLSSEEREKIYLKIAENYGGLYDVVSEADVGRIGRRDSTGVSNQAEMQINNAGMRSSRPYNSKQPGVYRIACLGDSMVEGSGGLEADRFCDQLEAFYNDKGILVEGARIETVALGLGSWTMVQEATYLTSRLSAYDPDLILLLSVHNDITDSYGVTGIGATTVAFSPEHRDWGSAFFSGKFGWQFGIPADGSALTQDLSPESRARWDKAMGRVARLLDLQQGRGKRSLLSVLDESAQQGRHGFFTELMKFHLDRFGIDEPFLVVSYPYREPGMYLPHDPTHPTRLGHSVLRDQYVRALDSLGWIPVPESELPPGEIDLNKSPDLISLDKMRRSYVRRFVPEALDFDSPSTNWTRAILGGLFPDNADDPLESPPWASVRAGFVLRPPTGEDPHNLEIEIQVPPHPELFPLEIDVSLQGKPAERFSFAEPEPSGRYQLIAPVPRLGDDALVLEVILETDSYFVDFNDGLMRSYQLVSAQIQ
jgi:lysophospholipase L1-like esterase